MKNEVFYDYENKKYVMNYKAPDAYFMMKDIIREEGERQQVKTCFNERLRQNEEDKKHNESIYARLVFCV